MKRYLDLDAIETYLHDRANKVPGMSTKLQGLMCWEGPDLELCEQIFGKANGCLAADNIIRENGCGFFDLPIDDFIVEL